ncbi:MAG TPA: helix-turn-helix domain-containing protein [Saprospiraceae bacterium]|nr:helix-turn-helix domain-containing protein [Saprospiraceae bacterium]
MEISTGIRKLFIPIQPTIKKSDDHVSYSEVLPDIRLQNVIYCYWQLRTNKTLTEPFFYRVVADGCIDIFFERAKPEENYVMGFCKKFTEFPLSNSFNYVGVRFLPTMFTQLFKIDASDLSNRFEDLDLVAPTTSQFIRDHIAPAQSFEEVTDLFDSHFLELVNKSTFDYDIRLYSALEIILQRSGVLDIEKDLNTGISQRQLRRLFEYYIGDTAKTFSKVVRFQNILRAKPSKQSLRQNKLFFDVGYYDQAHFIKEFKNFYGVSPSKAFGR